MIDRTDVEYLLAKKDEQPKVTPLIEAMLLEKEKRQAKKVKKDARMDLASSKRYLLSPSAIWKGEKPKSVQGPVGAPGTGKKKRGKKAKTAVPVESPLRDEIEPVEPVKLEDSKQTVKKSKFVLTKKSALKEKLD